MKTRGSKSIAIIAICAGALASPSLITPASASPPPPTCSPYPVCLGDFMYAQPAYQAGEAEYTGTSNSHNNRGDEPSGATGATGTPTDYTNWNDTVAHGLAQGGTGDVTGPVLLDLCNGTVGPGCGTIQDAGWGSWDSAGPTGGSPCTAPYRCGDAWKEGIQAVESSTTAETPMIYLTLDSGIEPTSRVTGWIDQVSCWYHTGTSCTDGSTGWQQSFVHNGWGVFIDSADVIGKTNCNGDGTSQGTGNCDTALATIVSEAKSDGATDIEVNISAPPCGLTATSNYESVIESDGGGGVVWQIEDNSPTDFETGDSSAGCSGAGNAYTWISTMINDSDANAKRLSFAVNLHDDQCVGNCTNTGMNETGQYDTDLQAAVTDAYNADIGYLSFMGAQGYYGPGLGTTDNKDYNDDFAQFNCDIRAAAISDPGSTC